MWAAIEKAPCGIVMGNTASDVHVDQMRLSVDVIVVFGFSGSAVYVEGFDLRTGENRFTFGTTYYDKLTQE